MTPEGRVKAKVVKVLKALGVYFFFPATHGFGRSGVPDIVCCIPSTGIFFAIECKAGDNKPTRLQELEIESIRRAGGRAIVVNESNIGQLQWLLEKMIVGA